MISSVRASTAARHQQSAWAVVLHCEEHLHEPLTLNDLAAVAGFSPHHMHRIFHAVTGETPKEYLRRLRLERAVYRFRMTSDTVLRVALDSGFATPETFTRAFVRRFGMSPSEYRSLLRAYQDFAGVAMGSQSFEGFVDETPLILRFDLQEAPVTVRHVPARDVIFVRHHGFENLLHDQTTFLDLWAPLVNYADAHNIAYSPTQLIGITPDNPYITDERHIRFDACLPIASPVSVEYPIGYRRLPTAMCVVRHHTGGVQEIAKTFASIGVAWIPNRDYVLSDASPFEEYQCEPGESGRPHLVSAAAYVPLQPTTSR